MPTMRAAVRERYGPPAEVVTVTDVERPTATGDQLLVRVHAASVNRADLDGIQPKPSFIRLFLGVRRPRQPRLGTDVAGVVEAVGPDVTGFAPGDRVFADLFPAGQGSFAEYVAAAERHFARIPDGLSFTQAATLPHSAILAVQGLRLRNGRTFKPGARVLIDGASGNVGPFAVQLAKIAGAHVTGVCRTDKVDFVRSLGADEVIDYTQVDYASSGQRWDWILAVDAHYPMLRLRRALVSDGVYVTEGGNTRSFFGSLIVGLLITLATRKWMGMVLWWKPFDRADLQRVTDLVASGRLRPAIDRLLPLEQAAEALRIVDDGEATGKIVLSVVPD